MVWRRQGEARGGRAGALAALAAAAIVVLLALARAVSEPAALRASSVAMLGSDDRESQDGRWQGGAASGVALPANAAEAAKAAGGGPAGGAAAVAAETRQAGEKEAVGAQRAGLADAKVMAATDAASVPAAGSAMVDAWPDPRDDGDDAYRESFDSIDRASNETDDGASLCHGWCPDQYLELVDCERKGLDRLKTAFQIENCAAATDPGHLKDVESKILKVAESTVFTFFRGAAAFFDYNMMCEDKNFTLKKLTMPRVYSNGDCHPENFGTMVQASNNVEKRTTTGDLVWGVNDFDQSFLTPFSWDLKRGAVGFALGIKDRGWALLDVSRVSYSFIDSYINTIMERQDCSFLNDERFVEGSAYVANNATLINSLFQKARERDETKETKKWLEKKMAIDTDNDRFVEDEDRGIFPLPDEVLPEFQASVDAWLYHGVAALAKYPNVGDFYKVLSVAEKKGSGTGSIGLKRFYILINGRYNDPNGYIVLEMKQEVNSVLEVFFHYTYTKSQEGKRAVNSMRNAWPYAALFYGWTTYKGDAYIIREKSKHAVSIDINELSKDEYVAYARHSGRALAFYHIRVRCPNFQCKLEAQSAVDLEICHNIQDYLMGYGVEAFKNMVFRFASKEYVRQNNAFELLNRFVEHRIKHNSSPLDILVGEKKPSSCRGLA